MKDEKTEAKRSCFSGSTMADSGKYDPSTDFASMIAIHDLNTWKTPEHIIVCSQLGTDMRVPARKRAVKFNDKSFGVHSISLLSFLEMVVFGQKENGKTIPG